MRALARTLLSLAVLLPLPLGGAFAMSIHDFTLDAIDGTKLSLADYKGKPILLVNTASNCGYTPQYTDLQKVWADYRARGLVVLGVPSNDFGGQEPGSAQQIKEFCEVNFDVDFPMTDKLVVRGDKAHPLYQWLRTALGDQAMPKWNFHKFLIGADGQPIAFFPTAVKPTDTKVRQAIEAALPKG